VQTDEKAHSIEIANGSSSNATPGGNAGGKIAYNRIPSAEDFW
jgi:hypothetical protein